MKYLKTLIWKIKFASRYNELCGGLCWRNGFYCAGISADEVEFDELMDLDPEDMAYEELTRE